MKQPQKPKIPKEPIIYQGIQYDSSFEVLFCQWLIEAKNAGYVHGWKYHPDPIILQESVRREYFVEVNGKRKVKSESLFQNIKYTPDFIVIWTEKAEQKGLCMSITDMNKSIKDGVFVAQRLANERLRSIIDIKPPTKQGGANASYRDLATKTPLIFKIKGYYVQKIVPINPVKKKGKDGERISQIDDCLFSRTWAPKEYLERARKDGKGFLVSYCKQKIIEDYERLG